jgi:hypothetical protein
MQSSPGATGSSSTCAAPARALIREPRFGAEGRFTRPQARLRSSRAACRRRGGSWGNHGLPHERCRGEDSNLRRLSQRVYSPPPLATREPLRERAIVALGWRRLPLSSGEAGEQLRGGALQRLGCCALSRVLHPVELVELENSNVVGRRGGHEVGVATAGVPGAPPRGPAGSDPTGLTPLSA